MIETKFKQTEVGSIPEDWVVIPISFLGNVKMCKRILKNQTTEIGEIPFYKIGTFGKSPDAYITRELYEQYKEKYSYPRKGTILISAAGTIGRIVVFDGNDAYFQDSNIVWIDNSETIVLDEYLYYYFSVIKWQTENGGIVTRLYNDNLKSTFLAYPKDKQEQHHISEALSNIENLISSLSKLIEKKQLIKQGAMQQLLTGKKRLPGFDGEWKEYELGLIVNIQRGSMLKSSEYLFGNIPVIAGGTTPAGFHNVANRRGRTITISASGANAGYISYYKEPIFATDCSTISEGDDYYIDFIYYSLLFNQKEIFRLQTGGAQPHIHPKDIAPLKVAIPCTYDEQMAIANILTTMDNDIESLKEEREKYVHIKEGMMHKLLTGQIRLIKTETRQTALSKTRAANVHFKRCVLAAEIADRLCGEKTFGHVKMEKLIFLTEHLCHIDIDSHYHRDAAGPYDNRALRSIDSQMKKQQWFAVTKKDKGYQYEPMEKRGEHKKYFDRYYSDVLPMFDKIINTFKTSSTEQCEIVATLYSAWDDLLHGGLPFSDEDILDEVLNNWHESKRRIERSRWQTALIWMRNNGFVPETENL